MLNYVLVLNNELLCWSKLVIECKLYSLTVPLSYIYGKHLSKAESTMGQIMPLKEEIR